MGNGRWKGEEMLRVDIEKMPSYNIGLERGMQKGMQKGIMKVAQKMIKAGMPIEDIINFTNLSKQVIEELKNKKL